MKKILIIDDNQLVGKMIRKLLEDHDYIIDIVSSPFGVLNKVRTFGPDLILLDINMPGLKGDRVATLLRENRSKLKPFSVVIFSSVNEAEQKEMVERGLADAYFVKTAALDGLADLIGGLINKPVTVNG